MQSVRLMTDVLVGDLAYGDRWYVSNGATAVGPISVDLVKRGLEAGRVPIDSFIRHEGWKVWRPLRDLVEVNDESGVRASPANANAYREITYTTDSGDFADSAWQADFDVTHDRPLDSRGEWPTFRDTRSAPQEIDLEDFLSEDPLTVTPLDDDALAAMSLEGATDQHDALLLALTTAIQAGQAEGGILHVAQDEGAVAICAHGPNMVEMLGASTKLLDPALVAATAGAMVIAEPVPGPAGQATQARLRRLGIACEGALMMPVRPWGRLTAMLEIGKPSAFTPHDIVKVAGVVEAAVRRLEDLG